MHREIVEKEFLCELIENDQSIGWLITLVAEDLGLPDWIKDWTLEQKEQLFLETKVLIQQILAEKKVRVGDLTDSGFREWQLSPIGAVDRISEAWRNLDEPPLARVDVAWFSLPDFQE